MPTGNIIVNANWLVESAEAKELRFAMSKRIRDQVIEGLAATGLSAADLSRRSGVSYDVITKLRHRPSSTTSAENAEKLLAVLKGAQSVEVAQPAAPPITRIDTEASDAKAGNLVPVYDVTASAGDGAHVNYESIAYSLAFPPDYLRKITSSNPLNLAIISVKGDSMAPTLNDDDIVMLDMSKTSLSYEGLFVIRIYDVLHVKRLSHSRPGFVMVISDNREKYPPREYSMADVAVVGKVLWAGGKV